MTADPGLFDNLRFHKYQALGNDYVVIDPQSFSLPPSPALVRTICDRHHGIGADGVLHGPVVEPAGFRVRIFNSDGSEAEKSGNGIRIFARYLRDLGYVLGTAGTIMTTAGSASFKYVGPGANRIEVDMGAVTFWSRQIPVSGPDREVVDEILQVEHRGLKITCLSLGNPHCVVRLQGSTEADVRHLGPLIEVHAMFPNRTNVQFLEVVDYQRIRIKIWERGVGYTLASGSSACAAASAARRLGLVGDHVCVQMPGGSIDIDVRADWQVRMTGDVRSTLEGVVSADLAAELRTHDFATPKLSSGA